MGPMPISWGLGPMGEQAGVQGKMSNLGFLTSPTGLIGPAAKTACVTKDCTMVKTTSYRMSNQVQIKTSMRIFGLYTTPISACSQIQPMFCILDTVLVGHSLIKWSIFLHFAGINHNQTIEFSGGASGAPDQLWADDGHRENIKAILDTGTRLTF